MTEAPFSWTSGQTAAGQLTIRAAEWGELLLKLAQAADDQQKYADIGGLVKAAGNAAPLVNVDAAPPAAPEPAAAPGWGNTPPAPPNAFAAASVPSCAHGPRTPVSKVGAKGPWKAWMCNAPQGGPKCDPIWVDKKDQAAWNNFPA